MAIILYDLAGAEAERRFSPYCWRTRMALAHKGLAFETVPWRFTEKDKIAFSGQGRVPVIRDGDRVVSDSGVVADWTEIVLHAAIIRFVVLDIWRHVAAEDREYFRRSREERFGMTLEECVRDREARLPAFRAALAPLRRTVERQPFLGGDSANYADYVVFGAFQWARAISDFELLAEDDPLARWRGRLLDLFDGLARRYPAYGG